MKNNRSTYLILSVLTLAVSFLFAAPVYSLTENLTAEIHASELPTHQPAQQLLFSLNPQGKAAINFARQVPASGFENIQDEGQKPASFREADNKRLAVYVFNFSRIKFNSQHVSKLIFPFHSYL